MEALDAILADWRACRPDGVVLRASYLKDFLAVLRGRLKAPGLSDAAREDAAALLVAVDPEPPPLVLQLRVDAGNATSGEEGVVHFLRFWRAMQELWMRMRPVDDGDEEPLAEEVSSFRDALLRAADDGALTHQHLASEVRKVKQMSTDAEAWTGLEKDVGALASYREDASQMLRLEEVSTIMLVWLAELAEDHLRGARGEKVRVVRDVSGCHTRAACLHLGATDWEVEAALRSFYASGTFHPLGPTGAWSSRGAKIRREEVQCSICAMEYSARRQPAVTGCCFQVLCVGCTAALTDETSHFRCPFCRCVVRVPERAPENRLGCSPAGALWVAVQFAASATRLVGELAASFQDDIAPHQRPRASLAAGEGPVVEMLLPRRPPPPADHCGCRAALT